MAAFAAALKSSFSWFTGSKPLPEREPFCATPRAMTGFLATLTTEQRKMALEYRGEDTHGDSAFAR